MYARLRSQVGITLLETLTVLALICTLCSLTGPALGRWRARFQEKTEIRSLVEAFQQARSEAARRNCDVLLTWTLADEHSGGGFQILARNSEGRTEPIHDPRSLKTLSLVRATFSGAAHAGFNHRGLPLGLGGSIHLKGRHTRSSYRISQNAGGRVRVQ
ncbi:MAG: GspH/FimT family pseudopilin [Geoalkalibacter sp.]|jgi:Tfp pilus assembly protein FimT|uniref:GspH/FimT family pseudopilin n=1 Tax=Geoalkalibacter sp. TaxID=3041440 RepID=UPI002A9557C3|nr:GspH/FimT family pseudopilin [Thermodesulfobacteriota bacterium]